LLSLGPKAHLLELHSGEGISHKAVPGGLGGLLLQRLLQQVVPRGRLDRVVLLTAKAKELSTFGGGGDFPPAW